MERRVLLAVTLSFLVLFAYQSLVVKPKQSAGRTAKPAAVAEPAAPESGSGPTAQTPAAPANAEPAQQEPASLVGDAAERDVVVESPEIRAVFTSRGAELKSWTLNKYLDDNRRPVDLVAAGSPASEPRGFALRTADEALDRRLRSALYRPSAPALTVGPEGRQLTFEFRDESGLEVRKTFEFGADGQPYVVTFTAVVTRAGSPVEVSVDSGPGLGDVSRSAGSGSFLSPNYYQKPEGILHRDGKVSRLPASKLVDQPQQDGRFRYVGVDDHYFLNALLLGDRAARVRYHVLPVTMPKGANHLVAYEASLDGALDRVRFYLGPKEFDILAATDRELVRAINFGIFAWLVVPLLRSLNWVDGFVGNYGWSIILLTIAINTAMFPLRHKSVVSMRKMQALQPEVKAIQDRYAKLKASDPARQKMNVELMNLYRERGVNPASGCVPMLLTFPVLFAFYSLLSQAIELRGAPFVGWIQDLSRHDPWYVTPLLMGATMVWQQRITPSTADPTQQKVMMFMPILFTFMFLWAPSGLVIYWFVSNLWAIGQQYATNYLIGPMPARAAK